MQKPTLMSDEDVQDMFEDGVDAFFNIERLGDEA